MHTILGHNFSLIALSSTTKMKKMLSSDPPYKLKKDGSRWLEKFKKNVGALHQFNASKHFTPAIYFWSPPYGEIGSVLLLMSNVISGIQFFKTTKAEAKKHSHGLGAQNFFEIFRAKRPILKHT